VTQPPYQATGLWLDVGELPELLQATLDQEEGFGDVAGLLRRRDVERIVITGSGASYYVALALWLTAIGGSADAPAVSAVPAGLLLSGAFRWRPGDALLAVSSSGELRDIVEFTRSDNSHRPLAVITGTPSSTIARAADACAVVPRAVQRAVTHTHAFCGAVLAGLDIWEGVAGDPELRNVVRGASDACARALDGVHRWMDRVAQVSDRGSCVVFGTGVAWAAALEGALVLKEIAQIPAEGAETREAATSLMTAATAGTFVLALPTGHHGDPLAHEAALALAARGAEVLMVPGSERQDPRLSPITSFPYFAALAIEQGLRKGLNVDHPDWLGSYKATARAKMPAAPFAGQPRGRGER
jgi:fructoselysine-6-P-deglycase FrlB-like protein